ncbi:DUF2958 domain-containing protein [Paenarthrobacter sp. YJN-5]|uniref:DUF2958 domain-containing protein n=1 Tax=Paenarthrobacter sp. YJN-5 TaxID=2735316 RepID=UPI0018784EAA|nr:DUF2958 domain-containing protein [Paenarthrobacter sp. YJN-5]QOT19248.1 DUF2958 domain-containing protein [Paenarthrobacter sp. YJN-5]
MTESINRQPQGIPAGGQFAPTAHAEPEVALPAPAPERPAETQRSRRGHDFYPPAEQMASWPKLYETDNDGPIGDKPIQAHYFQGGMDWYIAEYDSGENVAFGYVNLGLGGEWGYIDLGEVESVRGQMGLPIERDLDFKPGTPAKECIPKYRDEAAADVDDEVHDFGWDGPDEPDPLSPEDRKLWDEHHRFAFNYVHDGNLLGVTGFEDRDTVERFAGFAANAYMESGWDGMLDMRTIAEKWRDQERPVD